MQEIWNYLIDTSDAAWIGKSCLYSIQRVILGVLAAVIVGVLLGLMRSGLPERVKRNIFVKFLFEAPKFPPPIAWIPFVILLFGISEFSAYTIVFIGAFSPIFTNTYEGAESLPVIFRNTARSMEISALKFWSQIVFPYSLPHIFTGIRVGVSMGWMSVIAAEMISGQSGLGYSIQLNRLNLQYLLMAVDMLFIGFIGFLLFETAVLIEKLILPWNEKFQVI